MSYQLGELGDTWEYLLICNGFGENEEWPRRRSRTRRRRIKTEEAKPELEESGSQGNLDDEVSEPSQTLSINAVKFKSKTNPKVSIDNSQPQVRKLIITIPYQNKDLPHSQANISQKPAEDQIS